MSRTFDYLVLPIYPEVQDGTYKVIKVRYDSDSLSGLVYEEIVADNINKKEAYEIRKQLRDEHN